MFKCVQITAVVYTTNCTYRISIAYPRTANPPPCVGVANGRADLHLICILCGTIVTRFLLRTRMREHYCCTRWQCTYLLSMCTIHHRISYVFTPLSRHEPPSVVSAQSVITSRLQHNTYPHGVGLDSPHNNTNNTDDADARNNNLQARQG